VRAREHALGDTRAIARDEHGRSYWTSTDAAIDVLYHDCDPAQARETAFRLRPQARTPPEQACPLARFPDVPISYILMREDRMIRPEWSRIACPARLGVEPIELPSGHSPMLAQPEQLAQRLIELTARSRRRPGLPGTEPHAGRQSCSSSVAPSSAASPLPPSRITMSWFHENAGRASGPNRFIHHLVVRTRQS
jgi:hypothetical protein